MSNKGRTTLYVGVTNHIERRVQEHKSLKGNSFTAKYQCSYLLYFEKFNSIEHAIEREKQLKNWRSKWKWDLIKESNPDLHDLAEHWLLDELVL